MLQRGAITMNSTDLPPIPRAGEYGPQVCDTVRLHLAVLDDLSPEQVNLLFKHVSTCSACASEFQLLNSATRLLSGLPQRRPLPVLMPPSWPCDPHSMASDLADRCILCLLVVVLHGSLAR